MAKKLRPNYTFVPASNTVIVDGYVDGRKLLLITNTTSNIIIFNFADDSLKATSFTFDSVANRTSIVLQANCSAMLSTNTLQIFTDEEGQAMVPVETFQDPVNKLRTSQPQALIDTDFEYGTQISKWENLSMVNNRPFAFQTPVIFAGIGTITIPTGSRTVSVASTIAFPVNGTPITVLDSYLSIANGNFIIESGGGTAAITYTARATNTTGITSILDPNKTGIYSGTTYNSAAIGVVPTIVSTGIAVTVTTTVPHGLAIGNNVVITGTSAATSNPPNGTFPVAKINSNTSFAVYPPTAPVGAISGGSVFVRPQGIVQHRPFDGGVIFSTNGQSNFETTIRQTRRYFRYQSGKGVQVSSGTILKPNLQIEALTSVGTLVTVQTKEPHNLQPGSTITIFGATESAYNGTFVTYTITGFNTFQYTALSTPSSTKASGNYYASISGWYGAANRLGIFDSQNGIFFEFDGQTLYAVRRNSTFQLSGRVTVTNGSNTITQTDASFPTNFTRQLNIGDFIVLRGQSYRVVDIASDTSLTISPSYRGTTASFVIPSDTIDLKIPQSDWNLDKCDGTGPSGYNLDLTKMQMFYMDYSWYGAGFIRWGFRGLDGNVFYCHKMVNNNVNTEAYMRSGNLPARYESEIKPPTTFLINTLNLDAGSTASVGVGSTRGFPPSGTIVIRNASTYEYINYTGISGTSFTGLTRAGYGATSLGLAGITTGSNVATASTVGLQIGQRVVSVGGTGFPDGTFISALGIGTITFSQAATGNNPTVTIPSMGVGAATTFTYSATDPVAIELAYPTYAPTISHWGTSAIMDGRFDDDKSLVFTYGQTVNTTIATGQSRALFSIRVSPSVDNGISATFGARELVNRMQLTLKSLDISVVGISTANVLVRAYLNGKPTTATPWTNAVGNAQGIINSSLAQIADYAGGSTTVDGGEVTAGFWVSGTGSVDLSNVRDLGNSVLGGGVGVANTQIYPDGPDVLTIVATNFTPIIPVQLQGRLGWTEAQA
jgi:hypothetical protein